MTSLTTCTLEMRDAMNKLLTEVLLNLSKISATVYIAIPILEFLSSKSAIPTSIRLTSFCFNENLT